MVVERPEVSQIARIHDLKRDLLTMRRAIWPLRDLLNALLRDEVALVGPQTRLYLRDCYDHTVQLIDMIETYREIATGLVDIHLSSLSNRMNEVMKVLTIIATIFIPLTFIVRRLRDELRSGRRALEHARARLALRLPGGLCWRWRRSPAGSSSCSGAGAGSGRARDRRAAEAVRRKISILRIGRTAAGVYREPGGGNIHGAHRPVPAAYKDRLLLDGDRAPAGDPQLRGRPWRAGGRHRALLRRSRAAGRLRHPREPRGLSAPGDRRGRAAGRAARRLGAGGLGDPLDAMIAVRIEDRAVWVRPWLHVVESPSGGACRCSCSTRGSSGEPRHHRPALRRRRDLPPEAGDRARIGGERMLHALGFAVDTFHLNEGHAALLGAARLRRYPHAEGRPGGALRYDADRVRAQCIFTTHTPVEAGHDRFAYEDVARLLGDFLAIDQLRLLAGPTG
jgi:hypothetical protein